MYCVGLTGTIASGKSTVANLFKKLKISLIDADAIARELTALGQPTLAAIKAHFGPSVFRLSGELDRSALREIIFKEPQQRLWLEKLLHPLIRALIEERIKQSQSPYTIIEIPLLNKRSDYPYLDRILMVRSLYEQQIARIIQRDNSTLEQAKAILATQIDEKTRLKFIDDLIENDSNLIDLEKKIDILHHQYLQFASQKSS